VLPNLKAYSYLNHNGNDFPEATKASQEIPSLPIYPELEETQIQFIEGRYIYNNLRLSVMPLGSFLSNIGRK